MNNPKCNIIDCEKEGINRIKTMSNHVLHYCDEHMPEIGKLTNEKVDNG